jgi:hypothetical protein
MSHAVYVGTPTDYVTLTINLLCHAELLWCFSDRINLKLRTQVALVLHQVNNLLPD